MIQTEKVYILGCGAIGLTLAAHLACEGRNVVAVRTRGNDAPAGEITITVRDGVDVRLQIPVKTVALSSLANLEGIVVVTTKSYANHALASTLAGKEFTGSLVIMQNGVGVETPFLQLAGAQIYRCVLYATAQMTSENDVTFRPIAPSPIGIVRGQESTLKECVGTLTTTGFPFRAEGNIQKEIWRKAIINSAFNSICPLLEVDNGIFARDQEVADLAKEIVGECVVLAESKGISFTESELMEHILRISQGSEGVLISTLQDLGNGRETEIKHLNLELAQMASAARPEIDLGKTKLLGNMILAKSRNHRKKLS